MKRMKKLYTAMLLAFTCFMVMDVAYAVGTPAGTVIQSRSKVVYTSSTGAAVDTVYSNIISVTIAQLAASNISPSLNAVTTNSDSVFVSYPQTITNSGNGTDQFMLSRVSSRGWSGSIYSDQNGDGTLDAAEISAGVITQTPSISADETYKVMIRVFVPRDASLNGLSDTTVVTATSLFNNSKTSTANVVTTVNTANISSIGSGLSILPVNPMPGDTVTYSLTFTNNGSVSATGISISDLINTEQFVFVSASTSQGSFNGGSIPAVWTIGTVPAGGSVTISIRLGVLPSLLFGTVLNNTLTAAYTVGGNTFSVGSNNPSAAIGVVHSVQIIPAVITSSEEREDTVKYGLRVKNTGNSNDVLEMSFNSSKSLAWKFYNDTNPFGVYNSGDLPLTNTNTTPTSVDVNTVSANDTVKVLALAVVPVTMVDQDQDITTFTVSSAVDPSKIQSSVATTTFNAPVVTLLKEVSPAGNVPPGGEIQFTVTYQNIGHGKAYNVTFTETEPDSMTYVPNSVTIDGASKSDAADADGVTVSVVEGRKVITFSPGIVNAGAPAGVIRYRATIN